MFQNLVNNAIKFHKPDVASKVHIFAKQDENNWIFSVADNGIGIDPQYADRIFKIFQRLHTRDEYPGTGIGLAICKRIAEQHGGTIWIESVPGYGSTFNFTIPKRKEEINHECE
jgi:chemotaxis family two-component system sensor kinase Cph1